MSDGGSPKTLRILVLTTALVAMIALGIVMVTTIALIPSPPDPRERRRRILDGLERDPEENNDDRKQGFPGPASGPRQHRMYDAGADGG